MDSESTRLIQDLRAALLRAMTESREMQTIIDRLREVGWSAYIVIDEAGQDETDDDAVIGRPAAGVEIRMSGADLSFLRSLGIDPRPEPHGA